MALDKEEVFKKLEEVRDLPYPTCDHYQTW